MFQDDTESVEQNESEDEVQLYIDTARSTDTGVLEW